MPELQIFTTASTPGYFNFAIDLVRQDLDDRDIEYIEDKLARFRVDLPAEPGVNAFVARYETELALADDAQALVDHLDLLLTASTLTEPTRDLIIEHIQAAIDNDDGEAEDLRDRVQEAVLLVMASPEYLVQR